tara:strand:- start:665 stop:1183 length:519 start_codon:yes stop_codon:yes gene_type:complete
MSDVNTTLNAIIEKMKDKWTGTGDEFIFGMPQDIDNYHQLQAIKNDKLVMIMYPPKMQAQIKDLKTTDNAWNAAANFTFMVYGYLPSDYNVKEVGNSHGKAPLGKWSDMTPLILKWFNRVSNPNGISYDEMGGATLVSDLNLNFTKETTNNRLLGVEINFSMQWFNGHKHCD